LNKILFYQKSRFLTGAAFLLSDVLYDDLQIASIPEGEKKVMRCSPKQSGVFHSSAAKTPSSARRYFLSESFCAGLVFYILTPMQTI
jgi:hypothetical protein